MKSGETITELLIKLLPTVSWYKYIYWHPYACIWCSYGVSYLSYKLWWPYTVNPMKKSTILGLDLGWGASSKYTHTCSAPLTGGSPRVQPLSRRPVWQPNPFVESKPNFISSILLDLIQKLRLLPCQRGDIHVARDGFCSRVLATAWLALHWRPWPIPQVVSPWESDMHMHAFTYACHDEQQPCRYLTWTKEKNKVP